MTEITLSHNYARAIPYNSGYPRVKVEALSIDQAMQAGAGVVASGTTCWAWTIESNALIAAGAATATGLYA